MSVAGRLVRAVVGVAVMWSVSGGVAAYEADVHFGLTRWLALRAGFTEPQADAIAVGNQRVDGGLVDSTELVLEYACAGRFQAPALQAQRGRYPAVRSVPAPAPDRAVEAGGAAAGAELAEVATVAKGKEGLMLGRFGRALHPLQDSWAHQGVAATPAPGASLACDGALASAHPWARGGPDSHAADLTARWPSDVAAMARATYDALQRYGPVEGRTRNAAPWSSLAALVDGFSIADTKTRKRAWFVAQGLADTRFLGGTSLPDGPDPGPLDWNGRRFPPLPGEASQQHDAPVDVRAFFDRFLARWLGAEPIEGVLAEMGARDRKTAPQGDGLPRSAAQLAARLKLWKLRDHGAVADLAHQAGPFSAAQMKSIARMTRAPSAFVRSTGVGEALHALQPSTPAPMPMLPYIVCELPPVQGRQRTIAIARLTHAPYDSVGWVAERQGERWVLVDMVSSVDL